MPTVVSKIDKAIAGFMQVAYDVNDDDITLDAAMTLMSMILSRKLQMNVDNIVMFPSNSKFCVNAKLTDTLSVILENSNKEKTK